MYDNARKSAKLVKRLPLSKKKRVSLKPWFSDSCKDLYNTVKSYERLVNKFPQMQIIGIFFYSVRSKFRRICKLEEKQYKSKNFEQLSNSQGKYPKEFWDLLNKLNHYSDNKHQSEENLPLDEFVRFYKNLNKADNEMDNFQENDNRKFVSMSENITQILDESNNEITVDEILKADHSLKNGKSASADLISNEILKKAVPVLLKPLQNYSISFSLTGIFQKFGTSVFLVLIHKKGDTFDPGNYRTISISSNLGKLLNKIIHGRLLKLFNLISPNQIGFKEKSRTSDHLFTLKSIIDNYKQKHKKVFAAFIDLRKAFDSL